MMTIDDVKDEIPAKSSGKTIIQMLVGAAFGYGSVMLFDKIVGIKWILENSTPAGMFAYLIAAIFILIAIIVFAISFSKKMLTYNRASADMDDAEFEETKPINRWSAVAMLIYAAAFVLLALGNPASGEPQTGYFWGVVACMAGQTAISWYLWRRYDELWREVTKEACAISFTIIEIVLVIWAAAAVFGLIVSFDPLAVVVVTTAIYTLTSVWLTVRKGMTA